MKNLLFLSVCLFLAIPCQAGVIYVDANAPPGGDGSSWETAYKYLQDALADANSDANVNEIRVADGIYNPDANSNDPNGSGDREATFQLIDGVGIYGSHAGYSAPDPNARNVELYETILSGDLDGNDTLGLDPCDLLDDPNRGENSYHVVTGSGTDANAVLDGFTITAGNANGDSPDDCGGGMYNEIGNPTIANCTFRTNVGFCGGGMHNASSDPNIINCTFRGNSAYWEGAGMCNWDSSPSVMNCRFSRNWVVIGGGGMTNINSSPTVTNCTFSGNWADNGGGMYNGGSSPTLTNCIFSGNSARGAATYMAGGGMSNGGSSPTLTNCIFSGNSGRYGGGMSNYDSHPKLTNCTFVGNSAPNGNALACDSDQQACTVELVKCIVWDGGNEIWNNDGSTIAITYSDVQGGWPGLGNIDVDIRVLLRRASGWMQMIPILLSSLMTRMLCG